MYMSTIWPVLGADSFVLDNNKVGALYIESFEITK